MTHQAKKTVKPPRIRFNQFTDDWEIKKLGDLGNFLGGGTPSKAHSCYWEGHIPWISSSDIDEDNIYKIQVSRFISNEAIEKSATKIIPRKSILFVSRVGVGKLAVSKEELCTSQDFINFLPSKNNSYYIAYFFAANTNYLISLGQGMAIKGFTKSDLQNLSIPIPSLEEQEKIAACLSSLDQLIEVEQEKLRLLGEYKRGLMQSLFPDICNMGVDSDKENAKEVIAPPPQIRFKEFMDEWRIMKLGELCKITKGMNITAKSCRKGNIPVIAGGQSPAYFHDTANRPSNCITVSASGAYAGYVTFHPYKIWASDCSTIESSEKCHIHFAFYFLLSRQSDLYRLQTGGAQPHVYTESLINFSIPLPSLPEQEKIASCLSSLDTLYEAKQSYITTLQHYKRGLMQSMFSIVH